MFWHFFSYDMKIVLFSFVFFCKNHYLCTQKTRQ